MVVIINITHCHLKGVDLANYHLNLYRREEKTIN